MNIIYTFLSFFCVFVSFAFESMYNKQTFMIAFDGITTALCIVTLIRCSRQILFFHFKTNLFETNDMLLKQTTTTTELQHICFIVNNKPFFSIIFLLHFIL